MHQKIFLFIGLFLLWDSLVFAERLSVSASRANIRSGPGTKHDILWRVEKYYPLDILEKSGEWILFRDFEGDTGWIHQSLVNKQPSVVVNVPVANIRSGPGTTHEILFTIEKGVPFKILKRQKDWIYVEHMDGDKGSIHSSLIW